MTEIFLTKTDNRTEGITRIFEYYKSLFDEFQGKTVVIISHRFSTVRNADRIIVLENGEVVEQGTHRTLIENNGYYAKAFRMQAQGYNE